MGMFANRLGEAINLGDEATTSGWTAAEPDPVHRMPGETEIAFFFVSDLCFQKLFVRRQKITRPFSFVLGYYIIVDQVR